MALSPFSLGFLLKTLLSGKAPFFLPPIKFTQDTLHYRSGSLKFDRYRKENEGRLAVIHTHSKQMLNQGVQFVDLIVNMNLLLHIAFDDAALTEALDGAVRMKTVVLGRNEDIASVEFTETGLVDVEAASDEITLNYNAYLSPDLCKQEQLSGTHYRLPFYYDDIVSMEDKRIFHFADAVYIAKGNKIENVSFMKDSKGDLVSLLEADH
jgi:CRISPR-associated protein Cas5t